MKQRAGRTLALRLLRHEHVVHVAELRQDAWRAEVVGQVHVPLVDRDVARGVVDYQESRRRAGLPDAVGAAASRDPWLIS